MHVQMYTIVPRPMRRVRVVHCSHTCSWKQLGLPATASSFLLCLHVIASGLLIQVATPRNSLQLQLPALDLLHQPRCAITAMLTRSNLPSSSTIHLSAPKSARKPAVAVQALSAPQQSTAATAPIATTGSSTPRRVTADECFSAMCTMMGGLEERQLVGYAGQWRTWDVCTDPNSPPKLIDDSINIRLWRTTDAAARKVKQANLYQAPDKMAGPSTRFLPYLSANSMSGRPDGYGLRVWEFSPESELVKPDVSAWQGNAALAERSMKVLTVPDVGTTIINGAMPSGFEQEHQPKYWVLEFIIKEAGKADRRWASMNWYELGQLVVNRSINEDVVALPDDLEDRFIDPKDYPFQPRRDSLIGDIDNYVLNQGNVSPTGTATHFTFDQEQQLTVSSSPCNWSSGAAATAGLAAMQDSTLPAPAATQHEGPEAADELRKDANTLVQQSYPDMSYCRVPRDLRKLVECGQPSVVFEAGTVRRDGSLARWLLEYSTTGDRLLKRATLEQYAAGMTA